MARPFRNKGIPMQPTRLLTQEQAINVYFVTADEGTTIDDVMRPTYWAHVCRQLMPMHEVKVMCADGSWWAHLLVRSVGTTQATMFKLDHRELNDMTVVQSESPFIAKYRGPTHMHCVVRKDNGAVEKTNFNTADEARMWIENQGKALVA